MRPAWSRLWLRVRSAWGEMSYAQRRMLELRFGQALTRESRSRAARAQIDRLNRLLELESTYGTVDPDTAAPPESRSAAEEDDEAAD
ncbi:MAG: hypothetical protein M0T77_13590 [Actinomycetota bacterium]|nr:hypothetical protein [Actinomycetota bacterium]